MTRYLTLTMMLFGIVTLAFPQTRADHEPVVMKNGSMSWRGQTYTLDSQHLLLDGTLPADANSPYAFRDFREAARHFGENVTLYMAPHVYWVDDPDTPAVAVGKNGREPFGMVIRAKNVRFIGLADDASQVVLASQRGQTQGAIGNFTMFDFHVDSLWVENLTMGNYCNVDLDYRLKPELSRKKRNETITQAHVGYVHGRSLRARNVRFISRLNLNPLNGAEQSYYEDCHFECTDDALNGRAVYRHCHFDLYGQKPFWSTSRQGVLFIDCDFDVKGQNREMYFCKQGGPVTVVDCRYHAPEGTYVGWTPYPQRWLRCYQQNFTLNGKPYVIEQRHPENTVLLTGFQDSVPPSLPINCREAVLMTGRDSLLLHAPDVRWRVQPGFESYVRLSPAAHSSLPLSVSGSAPERSDSVVVIPANHTDETAVFCLEGYTADGRMAACQLTVRPSLLPPPDFLKAPAIKVEKGVARVDYVLDLQGRRDESDITWLRDGMPVAVSHDQPAREYRLTAGDIGHWLTVNVAPKHQRSTFGEVRKAAMKSAISEKFVNFVNSLETDFHDFPCQWQPEVKAGCWTVDGFKPADTAEHPWTFSTEKPMWEYGEGFNGAVGHGLLQAQRGARLMYTPARRHKGDMTLTLEVDPTKTAGQGFGSATGQYLDVCIKFDTQTLTGYGLRVIRTTKYGKAVDFYLVGYKNGETYALTEPISSTCYRTGCKIVVALRGNQLTAEVTTRTPKPEESLLPHEVRLAATVEPAAFGGIHIQHTGTCGESTTMFHRLKAEW